MAELLQNTNLKIEAYSFAEFLSEFQEAVLQGFRLDLDTNENFPQKFGDHLYAILVAAEPIEIVGEDQPEEVESLAETPEPVVETTTRQPRQPRKAKAETQTEVIPEA